MQALDDGIRKAGALPVGFELEVFQEALVEFFGH